MSEIIKVPVGMFDPNPYQPKSRVDVTPETAEYYGKSILEHGLLQIPLARHYAEPAYNRRYEMGDGWLRLQGHKWLVAKGHPEYGEIPVDIRDLTDEQMAHMVFEANGVRKNLEPIEKAKFFQNYMKDFKVNEKQLAKKFGISQGEISNTLRLLQLPEEIQKEVATGKVPQTHARELVRLKNKPEKQKEITQEVIKGGVSVKDLSKKIDAEVKPTTAVTTGTVELPCITCGSNKECGREHFYASNTGEYLCDRKTPMKGATEAVAVESAAEQVVVETTESTTNPVLTSILCDADYIGNFVAINSCQSLTEKPPKFKGLSKWEDSIYACTGTVLKGDKVLEADCYQVMEFVGNLRWGSYKGKNYVLVGSPVKFIPKAVKNDKTKSKKK